MKLVSILIPCYNEEDSLDSLYDRLRSVLSPIDYLEWEFIFVNDGSTDNTLKGIKKLSEFDERIKYLDLSRNFGKEAAMLAGMDFANGDALIIMDADLQHPPELIPELIKEWMDGYDDI